MNPTGTEARVYADIAARQALGIKKYGVSVEDNKLPLLEWLRHAYLETLDKAVYLRRAIESIEGVPAANKELNCPPLMPFLPPIPGIYQVTVEGVRPFDPGPQPPVLDGEPSVYPLDEPHFPRGEHTPASAAAERLKQRYGQQD